MLILLYIELCGKNTMISNDFVDYGQFFKKLDHLIDLKNFCVIDL